MTDINIMLGFLIVMGVIIGVFFLIASMMEKHRNKRKQSDNYGYSGCCGKFRSRQCSRSAKDNNKSTRATRTTRQQKSQERYLEIDTEIREVTNWMGVSEPINTSGMFEKVLDGKEKEVIDKIAEQLSLPMRITTKYRSEVRYDKNGHFIIAEVIVGNIPNYGSKYLKDYPCTIILYPGYNSRADRFIYVIAHELCHYVLQSLRPRLSDSEKEERLTDLAVIFGGFVSAYRTGWQSFTNGNAGYYLDEIDIAYICKKYENMLAECRKEFERISVGYKELLEKYSDTLLFIKICKILLEHLDEKITSDDVSAISACLSSVDKKEMEKILELNKNLEPFLKKRIRYGKMKTDEKNLIELTKLLKNIILPATDEISILMKYADKYI